MARRTTGTWRIAITTRCSRTGLTPPSAGSASSTGTCLCDFTTRKLTTKLWFVLADVWFVMAGICWTCGALGLVYMAIPACALTGWGVLHMVLVWFEDDEDVSRNKRRRNRSLWVGLGSLWRWR